MRHIALVEVGILLFLIIFSIPFSQILAVLSVTIIQILKRSKGTPCTIKRDLTGKVAVITGGNTGIGKETALELAKQGCQVVIGARDVKKSISTVEQIKKISGNNNIHQFSLDLGSKKSIDEFSQKISQKYQKINFLINNAGVMMIPQRKLTTDGFQMQFGVNHLGHFYLTYKLWNLLKQSQDLRIVNVSSRAHDSLLRTAGLDFDNLNLQKDYGPMISYQRSKLSNVLFTQELAERLQKINPNARCVSLHPGVVRTQLMRYMIQGREWLQKIITPAIYLFSKSPKQGAQTTLYTVLADSGSIKNGEYYSSSLVHRKNEFTKIPDHQKTLWKKSEEMLGITFDAK